MPEKSLLKLRHECEFAEAWIFSLPAGGGHTAKALAQRRVTCPSSLLTALAYPFHHPNGKTSPFAMHKNYQKFHHQMRFSSSIKCVCGCGFVRTPLRELTALPGPPIAGLQGRAGKGKGKGRKGKGRDKERREGRKEKGGGVNPLAKVWLRA